MLAGRQAAGGELVSGERRRPTTTCTNHCGGCGQCFHSLNAFDAHRQGDFASDDPELGRRCVHPLDMGGRLVALTEDGECRVHDDGSGVRVKRGVTIWTVAGDLARMRARFASERPPGAESGIAAGVAA